MGRDVRPVCTGLRRDVRPVCTGRRRDVRPVCTGRRRDVRPVCMGTGRRGGHRRARLSTTRPSTCPARARHAETGRPGRNAIAHNGAPAPPSPRTDRTRLVPSPRTDRTRLVPSPVLTGRAALRERGVPHRERRVDPSRLRPPRPRHAALADPLRPAGAARAAGEVRVTRQGSGSLTRFLVPGLYEKNPFNDKQSQIAERVRDAVRAEEGRGGGGAPTPRGPLAAAPRSASRHCPHGACAAHAPAAPRRWRGRGARRGRVGRRYFCVPLPWSSRRMTNLSFGGSEEGGGYQAVGAGWGDVSN